MTQQTINGTVYRVGQVLHYSEMIKLPSGSQVEVLREMVDNDLPLFKITALPNPDPVAVKPTPLTREELLTVEKAWYKEAHGRVVYSSCFDVRGGVYALGIPLFRTEAECLLYHEMEANND